MMVGSEGTLGVVLEAKLNLVPLPKAKAVLVVQFHELLEALGATPADPETRAVGRRGDGQVHPRSHAPEPQSAARARDFCRRRSRARSCASSFTTTAGRSAAASRRAGSGSGRNRLWLSLSTKPSTLPAQARVWNLREAALGLSMTMKEDAKSLSFVEDTAVAPEKLRDYIERFLAIIAQARNLGRRLRACFGRLPARAARW